MPNKAVFVDRDHTLIEDPGYLSDLDAVKLLPGVELAIKSLSHAGYKIVVVTNQSGVARGMLTTEALEKIHAEMRRQLSERDARLDAIYYCPYHPEGTVEEYAGESHLRKPQPGMLLKAAREMDIDLAQSWMVGDSPRDIEAGQRAGCRTIRVRVPSAHAAGEDSDEAVQADATVRNLVDAARVILREPAKALVSSSGLQEALAHPLPAAETPGGAGASMDAAEAQREILEHLRRLDAAHRPEAFSIFRMIATVAQVLVLPALAAAFIQMHRGQGQSAIVWAIVSAVVQVMALTFFVAERRR